ncbi:MAG: hypothetical protein J6B82_00245 [Bacteroidaceae bacterium]|nr:hypothetical protein [Bacteroidaceae bacterium]
MAKKLLHTLGYDEEGNILHVEYAEKGKPYTCPQCGDRIIARNNGTMQRPHFAHFKKSDQCSGESVLHYYFCLQAIRLLQNCIDQKNEFHIEWSCPYCNRKYSKDLLQQVAAISTDMIIEGHHPDITLLDNKGKPLFALKILIRKKLTKKTIHFYEEKGIILIQYQIEEEDWLQVENKLKRPNSVTFCGNGECYNFQFYQNAIRREYYSQKFKCKKCGKVVDGYMVRNTSALGIIGLDKLRDHEKQDIVSQFFRGKRATVADILVYGKCRCIPHSKGLVCLNKSDDFKEARQGKINKKK